MGLISRIGYLSYLIPLVLLWGAYRLGAAYDFVNLFAWLPLVALFGLLPFADKLIGESRITGSQAKTLLRGDDIWCQLIVWLAVPAQTVSILWATSVFVDNGLSFSGMLGWTLSTGIVSAIIGIAPGHELFHKPNLFERIAGGYLFSTVGYGGSKICHCRDHHIHVATEHDAATAKRGQSLYAFLPGAYAVNFKKAFELEKERLNAMGKSWLHPTNELLWWWGVTITFAIVCFSFWGIAGMLFYIVQSFIAVTVLEGINYIEHYGLVRQKKSDGTYEPVTVAHSWNCKFILSNMILLNLQRHSDHHESATKRFQVLIDYPISPHLPAGYPALILVSFIPPLWRRIIHPLLEKN